MAEKLKFAFYWTASCGGCEVAVLDIDEKILDVVAIADVVFWPVAIDVKYKDVEAMPDKYIDVCFFNGAIRNSEHEELAHLLRKKSKTIVSFGACSCFGGIPGLANFYNKGEVMQSAYIDSPSTENPDKTLPLTEIKVKEGTLTLPEVFNTVKSLDQVVDVDYYLPGCPPPPELIVTAVTAIALGKLPPKGSFIAGDKSVCEECPREKSKKIVVDFKRPWEIIPDDEKCFLEQGIICCGPATRSGCDAQCLHANIPCRGCFGPTEGIKDHGAKLVSAIGSILEADNEKQAEKMVDKVVDPAGTFYRFTLPWSMLRRKKMEDVKDKKEEVKVHGN